MTRKTTWANADGLNVGFGPNYPERQDYAVMTQEGTDMKVAKLTITYQSTLGSSGAVIPIPAGSVVRSVYMKTRVNWAGLTSLAFGDAGSTGGFITASQGAAANLTTAASPIVAGGAYAIATGTSATAPKAYTTATNLYFTIVGTPTAGESDVYVEFA